MGSRVLQQLAQYFHTPVSDCTHVNVPIMGDHRLSHKPGFRKFSHIYTCSCINVHVQVHVHLHVHVIVRAFHSLDNTGFH